jgi:hypothetical protein
MVPRWAAGSVFALAALALLVGVALPSDAQSRATHHYYVEFYRYPQGGFPTSGTLDLLFYQNGMLTGYYHPTDGGVRPVTGQLFGGNKIQLDFGGPEALHVNGTLTDGKIVGRGYRAFSRQLYDFRGLPIPNDQTLPHVTPHPWPSARP